MSYSCEEHGADYEDDPCQLCMKELEIEELRARTPGPPPTVVKHIHVHEPGPCPECVERRTNERRQRTALLLAVLFAVLASAAGNLLKLQDPAKTLVFVPAAVVALLGVLVPLRKPHEMDA